MAYAIRELDASDHDSLLALSRACDTGSEAFLVDRAPNFFAFGRTLGQTRYHGVFSADQLLGCLAVSAQRRYVGGAPTTVHYVHDLRVHPLHRSSTAGARLLEHAASALRQSATWCFATILDSNPHQAWIVRAAERYFGQARRLGCTAHVGRPLWRWALGGADAFSVRELAEADWERHYHALAARRDFASAEPAHWRARAGQYLAAYRGDQVCAVAKAVTGEEERRIVVRTDLAGAAAIGRLLAGCALRARLPEKGGTLALGYLAFSVRRGSGDHLGAFRRHLMRRGGSRWSFVFAGEDGETPAAVPRYGVRFTSTTFGFGHVPHELRLQAHELTLV